jgi:hypothetical protein
MTTIKDRSTPDPTGFWDYWGAYADAHPDEVLCSLVHGEEVDEYDHQDYCYDCGASPWDCACTYSLLSRVGN